MLFVWKSYGQNLQNGPILGQNVQNFGQNFEIPVKSEAAYAKEYEYESGASTIGRIEEFSESDSGDNKINNRSKADNTNDLVKALAID